MLVLSVTIGVLPLVPAGQVSAQSNPCSAPLNPIVAENCKTGNPASEWEVAGAGVDELIAGLEPEPALEHVEDVVVGLVRMRTGTGRARLQHEVLE